MSQIYSTDGRYLKDRGGHIGAYSGLPFPPPTDRSRPDTHTSRATTTTQVPNDKQSHPMTTSEARSRSRSQHAPTARKKKPSTKGSNASSQSKPTRQGSLAPVSRNNTGNDVKSMRTGISGHDAEPADGAQFGDLSESNVRGLGPNTGGGRSVLNSWVGKSLQSAEDQGFYEVVKYRKGLGNRRE
jgi:hypothetical protein